MTAITSKSIYFTHDSNAFSDPKILKLRKTYGVEGYGIFFVLLEKLSASNSYRIDIRNIEDLAYDMRVEDEKLLNIINNYDLFKTETEGTETFFYCPSHRLKMQYKDERADKKRLAGMARQAGLTPEEMSKQNAKAARARWDKHFEEVAKKNTMQGVVASDASKMQEMVASDALNKDTDKNAYKNKNEDKEKNEHKEQKSPSASSSSVNHTPMYVYDSSFVKEQINKHTPMFFNNDNMKIISSNYNEYMKYTSEPMTLNLYENLSYLKYLMNYNVEHTNTNADEYNNQLINDYVKNASSVITPNDISSLFKSVNEKDNMNKLYHKIIKNKEHQSLTPTSND
jgi:hypothetical protein